MIGTTGRGLVAPRPRAASRRGDGSTTGLRAKPWLFVNAIVLLWALAPELRRLIDWRANTPVSQIVIALPLVALVPFALAFVYSPALGYVDRRVLRPLWLWLGGFGTALLVGLAAGNGVGTIYSFLDFVLSACFGVWVTTLRVARSVLYDRVAGFMLNLAVPIALYSFYQFAVLPDWDRVWLINTKAVAFGLPFPLQFRTFSTLNAPAILADFLMAVILFNMPRLVHGGNFLRVVKFVILFAALVLTRVRAEWIGAVVGLLAYVALSPNRARNFAIVGALAAGVAIASLNADSIFGNPQTSNAVFGRIASLGNVSEDNSYQDRQKYFGTILTSALEQPLGSGLGVVGAAARLVQDPSNGVFDNGYIARLTEMGFFGTLCYIGALVFALGLAISRYRAYRKVGDRFMTSVAAAAIAVQIAFDSVDLSGDHHNSIGGTLFWLTLGLIYGPRVEERPERAHRAGA